MKKNYITSYYLGSFAKNKKSWQKKLSLLFFVTFGALGVQAQVTTNSGSGLAASYPDLATAITALNGATITSPVTITLAGNETAPAGGYVITANGDAANTITIAGNTSTITASSALASGSLTDAIFKLQGADYITIEGFTMLENAANITNTAASNNMTEWGVALLYATATDGCQNIKIQNNTIDLNRNYQNTFGIYANSTHNATTITTVASATGASGGNSGLKIYSNTITDVNNGIVVVGPTAAADNNDGIDIGGNSSATGNTISNYGTTGSFSGYANVSGSVNGIVIRNSKNYNVSYNTITSSNGGVILGTVRGVYVPAFTAAPSGTISNFIKNNSLAIKSGLASGQILGVVVETATTSGTASLDISNNDFNNFGHTVTGTGAITLLSNNTACLTTNINNNTFSNISVNTSGSFVFMINNVTKPANSITNVNNNQIIGSFSKTGSGGSVTFYNNSAFTPVSGTENNLNNNFSNVTLTGGTGILGWICKDGSATSPFGPAKTVTGNIFNNITTGTGATTILTVANSNSNTTNNVTGNTISNITATTGAFIGIELTHGKQNAANNTITNITGTTGLIKGINVGNGSQDISNNTINTINTTTGQIKGISATTGTNNIFSNTIHTFAATGNPTVFGIDVASAAGTIYNIYKNKIYNLEGGTGNVTANTVCGIVHSGAGTASPLLTISNNIIGDLRSSLSGTNTIVGINIGGTITADLYHNTIVLNASAPSTGITDFGSATISTGSNIILTLKNNILVNTSGNFGTGLSTAFRKSADLANYTNVSNNNLLYATTIFYDGTTADATLAAFQARQAGTPLASGHDSASISVVPSFVSTVGANAGFLHISPSVATTIDGGGTAIPSVTDDFDGEIRNTTTPDIGADEFTSTILQTASSEMLKVRHYPNPVTDVLHVEYAETITAFEIYNVLGQKVASKSVNDKSAAIDMSNLPGGMYLVKIQSQKNSKTIKVLKK